ncbi:DUF2993 domain-containing protein [Brasilonema bromeliae]|uniref:DUF2993 domain-containing protein n=1 Tax=Brasilonema bromeliae SPC951 TaxID=385972 RepID=A0ABX1PAM9_9CYAN|nr:DUF2993 domain-containing protein [Brasilonema bromeliae]NMG21495.1 DUF2993 domain-containing protein [Brasilonema bromeliae SPC951]
MSQEQRIEEQMLSHEAEKQVSQQVDKVEKVDVDVQTDLLKIFQGQADGVSFEAQGLVKQDIRVQEIKLQTDSIDINPLSVLFGQIELNQPVNTTARIVLIEADINHALTSKFVRSKMQNFELNVDGEIVGLQPQEIQIHLLDGGKMAFTGKVLLKEKGNTRSISFTAQVCPRTQDKPIMLENFNCTHGGEGISLEVVVALMQKVKELVNLPYYEYEKTVFRVRNMDVEKGNMTLLVDARLKQIPSLDDLS